MMSLAVSVFFFQAEDGIRDKLVTGVQTCALPISARGSRARWRRPALLSEKILQPAKARARARAAGTARPASCGRSATRAAGSCRPAWWERASLSVDEFGGNFPEPG